MYSTVPFYLTKKRLFLRPFPWQNLKFIFTSFSMAEFNVYFHVLFDGRINIFYHTYLPNDSPDLPFNTPNMCTVEP